MRRIKGVLLLLFFTLPMISWAAGDVEQGRLKAQTCMGCHGVAGYTNVYPTYHVPKIGGQHADYLMSALKAYASGARKHPTMQAQAKSMSEQDMEDIAAYLSSLKKQ